jgi:polyisoprenoid-binding protein YceI
MGINFHKAAAFVAEALLLMAIATGSSMASTSRNSSGLLQASAASLELDGNSTLHHYSAKAQEVSVNIGVDGGRVAPGTSPAIVEALIRGHSIKTLDLTVPVDKLNSGEKALDTNMRSALKSDRYRDIRFHADSYDVLPPSMAGTFVVILHGRLSLAGVERPIDIRAAGTRVGEGFRFSGSKDLLMSDYHIKPPTMMFGAIKTADLITVKFNATLQIEANQ